MARVLRIAVLLVAASPLRASADVRDRGIYPELDAAVPIETAPPPADSRPPHLLVDAARGLATLYYGEDPVSLHVYPLSEATRAKLLAIAPSLVERGGSPARAEDRDGDGIVDRLDIVRGTKKLMLNKAAYHERYVGMPYPDGDVPRTEGVCSDTIVRALRNAGVDLQRAVHEDLTNARAAYPNVEKIDASINHRRVKTILVWFKRHFQKLAKDGDYQPGDIVFFDTFPSKEGAEHVGIVSDRRARDGNYLVVNNWTDGTVDAEMALLGAVPVTDHFRIGQVTPASGAASHAVRTPARR